MRIVHVSPYLPPDRVGGVGEVVAHLHEALLQRGHDSFVVTSGTTMGDPTVRRLGATPFRFAFRCVAARSLLKSADVVHVHHGEALGLIAATKIRRIHPPILLTLHSSNRLLAEANRPIVIDGQRISGGLEAFLQRNLKGPTKSVLDRLAIKLADEVSFISRAGAIDVRGAWEGESAVVVHNGVPPTTVDDDTRVEHTELLYVGTASQHKRTTLLPYILEDVHRSLPRARLRVVGFAPARYPDLVRLFDAKGLLESVVWEGEQRSEHLGTFYRSSDVLVMPSAYEGLPMVILEALRAGLPCVATRVGGMAEVIEDGVNGILVEPDNPRSTAKACLSLLSDPRKRLRMSLSGTATIMSGFSMDRQIEGLLSLYEGVLSP